jgi:hypothetical protein
MNFNFILGWSIAALIIVSLIVITRLKNKSRDQKKLKPLLEYAAGYNSVITQYDIWDKTLIGLDNNMIKRLFFIRKIPDREIRETIILSEVSECRMYKTNRKVKYKSGFTEVIDRIDVILYLYNHRQEVCLEFFNTDYDNLTLTGELQIAQKWTEIIKNIINATQDLKPGGKEKELVDEANQNPLVNNSKFAPKRRGEKQINKEYVS